MKSIESSLVVQAPHEDVRISLARSSFPILPLPQKFSIKSLGGEFPPISSSSGIEQQGSSSSSHHARSYNQKMW